MKRFIINTLIASLVFLFAGCQKFLNVEPKDSLSGNNFWQTADDAEGFTRDIYRLLKDAFTTQKAIQLMGEVRGAPIVMTGVPAARGDFYWLARNNVKDVIAAIRQNPGTIWQYWQAYAEWDRMSDWTPFYKVIQEANNLYEKVDIIPDFQQTNPSLYKQYKAEAVFLRCFTYFYLIQIFGDVPHYTEANSSEALERTDHVEVAKKCLADLAAVKDDLPWTTKDPANRAVRAMRGSALGLMVKFNMWLAGFDKVNDREYHEAVDVLGDELYRKGEIEQKAYQLLPLSNIIEVFVGRSKEGLFEIPQIYNYGEASANSRKTFYSQVSGSLFGDQYGSPAAYEPSYLRKIFPEDETDGRVTEWFEPANMYSGGTGFRFWKFFNYANTGGGASNSISTVSINYVFIRYADIILLQAEALEALGREDKAIELLNRIRLRAEAGLYPGSQAYESLAEAIYYERCKELLGEGHYYFDLVRTGKFYDPLYAYYPVTYSQFLDGAWTWPINPKAFNKNPLMTYNSYWN